MSTSGVVVVQETGRILFRASLKDLDGADLTTGTTEIRVLRVNDDGTLDVLDWTTFAFVATGSGTPDDEDTMTQRNRRDSTGADVATGIWTKVLSTLTAFTEGQVYIAKITNTGATPASQEREFQFGGVEASSRFARAIDAIVKGTIGTGSTNTTLVTSSLDPPGDVTDKFKGRVIYFDRNTTTVALRGQASDITGSSSSGGLTVTALTTSPVNGDLFTIS